MLAGELFADAGTKDSKSYPKRCVRHFEFYSIPLSLCSLKYVPLSTVSSRTKEVLVGQLFNDAQRTAKLIQNSMLNIMNLIPL